MHYFAFPFLCVILKVRKANTKLIKCVFASAQNNSALTERVFIFDILVLFENLSSNVKFLWNVMRISAALNEDYARLWYIAELFLDWEIFQTEFVEKIKTRIINIVVFFFLVGNRSVYETMLENIVPAVRQQTTDYATCIMVQMRFACRIFTVKMKIHAHGRKSLLHYNWHILSDIVQW